MRAAFLLFVCLLLVSSAPRAITKTEYDRKCQETVNVHNTLTGQVLYQGSKEGYDYFLFEPFGSVSHHARVKEGAVGLKKRFPYNGDRKNWVVAYPDWAGATNIVTQTGATNTKF